jgi:glycosyltransferase involved in cell wall biosynthesis
MMTADIFCLPSYREGFGLTIIEAAACGIPTVASRIYGITDAIKDKETGLLFNAGDVTTLTQMLINLLKDEDLCHQLGEAARIRALALFDSQNIIKEALAVYNELLENQIHLHKPRMKD